MCTVHMSDGTQTFTTSHVDHGSKKPSGGKHEIPRSTETHRWRLHAGETYVAVPCPGSFDRVHRAHAPSDGQRKPLVPDGTKLVLDDLRLLPDA